MEILIQELDNRLQLCRIYNQSRDSHAAKTFYDQAFGMLCMFKKIFPEKDEEVCNLWMNNYKHVFEKIIYGL